MALPLKNLGRFSPEEIAAITRQAETLRSNLDAL
jgi:hypothetical protein